MYQEGNRIAPRKLWKVRVNNMDCAKQIPGKCLEITGKVLKSARKKLGKQDGSSGKIIESTRNDQESTT